MPHLHLPEDIAQPFEEAVAQPARRGKTDLTPAEELANPVPAIHARREARRKHLTATRAPLQDALPNDVDATTRAPLQGASDIDVDTCAGLQGALAIARPRAGRATQQKELHSCYTVSSGASHGDHPSPCAEEVAALCAAHNSTATAIAEVAAALTEHSFTGVPSSDVPVACSSARRPTQKPGGSCRRTVRTSNGVVRAIIGHPGE